MSSETSAFMLRKPGKFPKEHRPHSEHGESLKTTTTDSVLANSKTQNAFLFTVKAIFRQSRLPPSGGTWKYAKAPSTKKTWRDSLRIDMLLSAVSVLVVAQSSSEIPEGLMNNPVLLLYSRLSINLLKPSGFFTFHQV